MEQIQKRKRQLHEMQRRLNRWIGGQTKAGKHPTLSGTQKQVDAILAARHRKEVFAVTVQPHVQSKLPCLTYHVNTSGIDRLCRTLFGKTLIFTNRDDWSDEDIDSRLLFLIMDLSKKRIMLTGGAGFLGSFVT